MIKFIGETGGKRLYGFGLSSGNMDRLIQGRPILIDLDVLSRELERSEMCGAVLIFGGKTEQEMVDQLNRHGWLEGAVIKASKESE